MRHILVTGGAGYIGSVLVPKLIEHGYKVTVVDNLTFGNNLSGLEGVTFYERDVLDIDPEWLDGVDAVIHLAGLSNDPMANFRPRDNFIHNNAVTALMVYLCKQRKVKRFIFGGTCSVYGFSADKEQDEECPVAPLFPYGLSKLQAEHAIMMSADEHFRPIIFRQATVFGWAPRLRFDLVVNTMTKYGITQGKIRVNSPDLWRPLISVNDLADAYVSALRADLDVTGIFNIAGKNYTILQIAQEVQRALVEKGFNCELDIHHDEDMRNYRVNTDKAQKMLGITPLRTIKQGVHELIEKVGEPQNSAWLNPDFINAEVYKKRILKEERSFKLWKKFILELDEDTDRVKPKDWHQEGP